jgi:hypothetical protein
MSVRQAEKRKALKWNRDMIHGSDSICLEVDSFLKGVTQYANCLDQEQAKRKILLRLKICVLQNNRSFLMERTGNS